MKHNWRMLFASGKSVQLHERTICVECVRFVSQQRSLRFSCAAPAAHFFILEEQMEQKTLTGYPSIDKPWLKYYSEEARSLAIPDGSMFDYMYQCNADYPEDIAIEYYGRTFTYGELFRQINQCARSLTALGIKKGDIVTVQAIPLPQVVVIIYALTRIGACGNMLYPDAKAYDVVSSMKKTQSRLLIVVDKLLFAYEEDLPETFNNTILLLNVAEQMSVIPRLLARRKAAYTKKNRNLHTVLWREFISGNGESYQENHDGDIPAFMLRTGGTTGIPKEVVLNSENFNSVAIEVYYSRLCSEWKRQNKSLLLLPPFIAFGIGSGIHNSLTFGTKLIITLDVTPKSISKLFLKFRPNYITAGTVQIEQFMNDLERQKTKLGYIEMLAVGGEAMSASFEKRLNSFLNNHRCYITPIKGYGLTETAAAVTMETVEAHQAGSVGIPLANCNIKVVDPESHEELTYGTPGEVYVSTPGMMLGYYQDQQATDEVIEIMNGEKWLHTGDIGMISKDGLLTITGRIKRIIVCKEGLIYHKVFPLLIEDQLSKLPGVKEISIVGRPDDQVGNLLVAFIVTDNKESKEQAVDALKDYCSSNLQSYERPVEYIVVDSLPRTLIGKVDYRALEERAARKNEIG